MTHRVTRQGSDVGGDVTQQEAVSGMWRTAYGGWRFRREGLRHSPAPDAWQEYDDKTAELPDAKARAVGARKGPPTVDLGRARSNGWR